MSTLVITLKSNRPQVDLARFVKNPTDSRGAAHALRQLFERLLGGSEAGSWTTSMSASSPVQASGTITLTNASIVATNTLTIFGVVFTAVASGATGPQFNIGASAVATAANIVAAVNANATVAALGSLSANSAGVITATANPSGPIGNLLTLATNNTAGFTLSGANLANGAGGAGSPVNYYSRGLV